MDEIDRPGEGVQPRPRSPYNPVRRPQSAESMESLDEVDRPSDVFETVEPTIDESKQLNELIPTTPRSEHDVLPATPRSEPDLNVNSDEDEKEDDEEKKAPLKVKFDPQHDNHDFEIISTPDVFPLETPDGAPTTVSNTDGPFNHLFKKQSPQVQTRMEKTDREGITSKHVTYYPKEHVTTRGDAKVKHEINSDYFYDMNTFPRGKLTLINVKYFQKSSGMGDYPRHGTDKDAEGLVELFLDLGFIVDRFDNPNKREILSILKAAANEDYSNYSCCACALLSHGEEGIIYGTDGFVKIKEITRLFRSRSLAGKPKLFLFQACQGSEYMNPLDSVDGPGKKLKEEDTERALTLPSEADFLYAYSTVPGFYSWRNSRRGSWFMESLVDVFRSNAHKMDVVRMLTRVNATVAHRKSRTDDKATDDKRQIASIITQMRKDFFLFPPYGPLPSNK